MSHKHILTLITIIILAILPSKILATSWAYPFVVWDGYIYVVGDETVSDVERKIGQVTKYSDMESYAGNFSNVYKKGTNYYSIKGISTDIAIAIQESEETFIKATRQGEYAGGKYDFTGLAVAIVVLVAITAVSIYVFKVIKKST
ncbi:hypothetical protein [Bacillus sp. Marseille-P3661]|uniref:hypothetical protein n=1 Tax=Bacillus sp. Marseille-P3661 TaxID=1936234 RepID=UPI0015E1AA60|nr:hypothetical protein [Bacillus sp. Marseille-P3661]